MKLESTDARKNSLYLQFGDAKKSFFDFGAISVEKLSFPSLYIVIDVKDWDISAAIGDALCLNMKTSSTMSQNKIASFM